MGDRTYSRPALTWALYSCMFVFGVEIAVLPPLLPYLFKQAQLDSAQVGSLFVFLNGGSLLVTLVSGPLFDRFGFRLLLVVASFLAAIAVFSIGYAGSYAALAGCAFLLGLGGGLLNSGGSAFMADLYPEAQAAALSRLGVFFGVGACFIPLFIGTLLNFVSIRTILTLTSVIAMVPAFALLALAVPPGKHAIAGFPVKAALRILSSPLVLLVGILLFFQSGNEMNSNAWIAMFLVGTVRISPERAPFYVAGLWAGVLLGRLISPLLLRRVNEMTLVQMSALGGAVSLVALVLFPHPVFSALATVLAGFTIAPVFPCVLGYATARYPALSGTIVGSLMSIALVGGMLLPWFAGYLVQQSGRTSSGLITAVVGLVMVLILQTVIKLRWTEKESDQ